MICSSASPRDAPDYARKSSLYLAGLVFVCLIRRGAHGVEHRSPGNATSKGRKRGEGCVRRTARVSLVVTTQPGASNRDTPRRNLHAHQRVRHEPEGRRQHQQQPPLRRQRPPRHRHGPVHCTRTTCLLAWLAPILPFSLSHRGDSMGPLCSVVDWRGSL